VCGSRRHLNFFKCTIFIGMWDPESRVASVCQMSSKSVNPYRTYCSTFQNVSCRHLGFSKFSNFRPIGWRVLEGQDASPCQILSKLVKQFLRYHDFLSKIAVATILDFRHSQIILASGAQRAEMHRHAHFRQISSIYCIAELLQFLKMVDAVILDFKNS